MCRTKDKAAPHCSLSMSLFVCVWSHITSMQSSAVQARQLVPSSAIDSARQTNNSLLLSCDSGFSGYVSTHPGCTSLRPGLQVHRSSRAPPRAPLIKQAYYSCFLILRAVTDSIFSSMVSVFVGPPPSPGFATTAALLNVSVGPPPSAVFFFLLGFFSG